MKSNLKFAVACMACMLSFILLHATDGTNFYSFAARKANRSPELEQRTNARYKNHPEFGVLPAGSPCTDCFEELDKRSADSRTFLVNGSKGKHFFTQQSLGAINFLRNGNWLSIDSRLQPTSTPGIFAASQQPNPVTVDLVHHETRIECNGSIFVFNQGLELAVMDAGGSLHSMGEPDWTHYTAGDGGVKVFDFYPGIDVEFVVWEGRLKTNVILNQPLSMPGKFLVLHQGIQANGLSALRFTRPEQVEEGSRGELAFMKGSDELFRVGESKIFDASEDPLRFMAGTTFDNQNFIVYVPMDWLNNASIQYPVTIDPLVSASQNLAQAAITGSGYNATCFTGGCNYALPAVNVPAGCAVTDIRSTFSYLATNACSMKDGGIRIHLDSCNAPSSNFAFTVGSTSTGVANADFSLMNYVSSCIHPPQCAAYSMNFSMDFFRCNMDVTAGCSSNCIAAATPWTITVEGHTVEADSGPPAIVVCTGDSVTLSASARYGVQPCSFSWSPGSLPGQNVTILPAASATYTCTVADVCGNISEAYFPVTVANSAPAAVSITPGGPLCGGSPVNFVAHGVNTGSAPAYDWYINGNLIQSGPLAHYAYTPALNGDSISVQLTSNSTCLTGGAVSAWVHTDSTRIASVSLFPSPTGPYCVGQTITLTATPTAGGPSAKYGWTINNNYVSWTTDSVFTYTILPGPAKSFRVWMVSALPCVTNDTVGSLSRAIVGMPNTYPQVTIVPTPSDTICAGAMIVFSASTSTGGSTPSFQWYQNGVPVGTSGNTYASSLLMNGDAISVTMTTSATCAIGTTASDTDIVTVIPLAPASVSVTQIPNGSACPGDCLLFSAIPQNGGSSPSYQWHVNGANAGTDSPIFTVCNLSDGDIVSVTMMSNSFCASPPTANFSTAIQVIQVDTSVSLSTITLTAAATSASYQWLYCDSNMIPVPGATGRSFTASANGHYAVSVTQSGCTDTSNCWQILGVGIDELQAPGLFRLFPNPAHQTVSLQSDRVPNGIYTVRLTDVPGKILYETSVEVRDHHIDSELDLRGFSAGLYFIYVDGAPGHFAAKLMKQ